MDGQVRTAIYEYMLTGAGLSASNVFWLLAPQETTVDPVVVMSLITNPQERDTLQDFDEYYLQFSVYGKTLTECETLEAEINRLWDFRTVELENLLDGKYKISGLRRQYRDQLQDDKDYWHLVNRYVLELNIREPNGFIVKEMHVMHGWPPPTVWPGTLLEIEFDMFIPLPFIDTKRADGSVNVWKPIDNTVCPVVVGYGPIEWMEMNFDYEYFEIYTNDVYIGEAISDFDLFGNWSHFKISLDFAAHTFYFKWGKMEFTDVLDPGTTMADFYDPNEPWVFLSAWTESSVGKLKAYYNPGTFPNEGLNPNTPLDNRIEIQIKNMTGIFQPDFTQAFADEAKTQRRKAGQVANLIECSNGATLESKDYSLNFMQKDDLNYQANGDFENGVTFWSSFQTYPYTGGALPTFEAIYTSPFPRQAGWAALHCITSATLGFQGVYSNFDGNDAPNQWKQGHVYRINYNIYIRNTNRRNGSNVNVRLWFDDADVPSFYSGETFVQVGKWTKLHLDILQHRTPTLNTRHGIYVEVDAAGPIEFYLEDVRMNAIDAGFTLKRF